ncbi:MAG: riboflavin synthase [Candidatus Omnitrophota bacterium]
MFTGIIEELGEVKNISKRGRTFLLEIRVVKVSEDIKTGDSVSLNGACLTVVKNEPGLLGFEVMPLTFEGTNLKFLGIKDKVNLERALKLGERLSGHFVTGHVDCIGIIRSKSYSQDNLVFEITVPNEFMKYILEKGSVALDGISLTVAGRKSNTFSVYIIPHTLKNTTLGFKGPSDKVNIEFDILAKRSNPK